MKNMTGKFKFRFDLILAVFVGFFIPTANAWSFDPTAIIDEIKKVEGYDDDINKGIGQVNDVMNDVKGIETDVKNDLEHKSTYGKLEDEQFNQYLWSNDHWLDALNNVSSDTTKTFNAAQKAYETIYPVSSQDSVTQQNSLKQNWYGQSSNVNRAALAASQVDYDQINGKLKDTRNILENLDSNPSAANATQLTARLIADQTFLLADILKNQTIQTQVSATQAQGVVNGMSDESHFMDMK